MTTHHQDAADLIDEVDLGDLDPWQKVHAAGVLATLAHAEAQRDVLQQQTRVADLMQESVAVMSRQVDVEAGKVDTAPPAIRRALIEAMRDEVRAVNEANGWYDEARTVGDDVALLHSEVSEALEAYRDHGLSDATPGPSVTTDPCFCRTDGLDGDPCSRSGCPKGPGPYPPLKPEGFGSELADVLIRLLDTCERRGVDLAGEYERKIAYNRTRGHRHGGKLL